MPPSFPDDAGAAADTYNRALERDVSTGDMPNVTVVGATYYLPAGKDTLISRREQWKNSWRMAAFGNM
jgi:hypothetical protein